jgi:hypothetical protein
MAVKALFAVSNITASGGDLRAYCKGHIVGGSAFDGDFIVNPESPNLNSELAEAVKAYLISAHSVSFVAGDVVRMLPALL